MRKNKMAKLIYLVGLPGSGKSTYANKLKEKGYKGMRGASTD